MGLQQKLDAFKAEFLRTAPVGRPALYETKIEELRASFALDRAIRTGEQAPEFTLPDQRGKGVSLATLLGSGPAVVTFYRGRTQRAYAKGEPFSAQHVVTEEGKKLLFGQTAASVARN